MSRCGPVAEFADWEALNLTQLCFTGLEIVHPRFHNIISIILSLNNLEIHWYLIITHFINRHFFPVWQLNFWSSFQLVCLDIIRSNWNFCVCPLRNGFQAESKQLDWYCQCLSWLMRVLTRARARLQKFGRAGPQAELSWTRRLMHGTALWCTTVLSTLGSVQSWFGLVHLINVELKSVCK